MATDKQIRYALYLLNSRGFSTNWMNAEFKALGATMRERNGKVEAWLKSIGFGRVSNLIDTLKTMPQSR